MTVQQQLESLPIPQRLALAALVQQHGARVRRAEAMAMLGMSSPSIFKKVVDANPGMKHRIPGEEQDKYLTAVIFLLLPASSRCATRGEEL